jgi:hypothetical protein
VVVDAVPLLQTQSLFLPAKAAHLLPVSEVMDRWCAVNGSVVVINEYTAVAHVIKCNRGRIKNRAFDVRSGAFSAGIVKLAVD